MKRNFLKTMLFILIVTLFCVSLIAKENNITRTLKNYENLTLRTMVFNTYCNIPEKLEALKGKINEIIADQNFGAYFYLVESSQNFQLKCQQIQQDFVNHLAHHALKGRFHMIDSMDKYMKKAPKNGVFLGELIQASMDRLIFDAKTAPESVSQKIIPQVYRLQEYMKKTNELLEKKAHESLILQIMEWPFEKFYSWYEGGMRVSVSDKDQIGQAFNKVKLNLNDATPEKLTALPGFDKNLATLVHKYIQQKGGLNTYRELADPVFYYFNKVLKDQEKAINATRNVIERIMPITRLSDITLNKKKWTMLVFINADNDLESAGTGDINEMEAIGSDENINVVVQIDRHEDSVKNGKEHVYDVSNGNWTGTRRYFIEKDNDPNTVTSQIKGKLGETDSGTVESLSDFVKWGVKNYPAEHYYIIVWNHGGGLSGISWDDESGSHIDAEGLMRAAHEARVIAGKKIDIVNYDACLMGMIEICHQIKKDTDILIASEELEPGYGLPYADMLKIMVENPNITPDELAKEVVRVYTESYVQGGSQAPKKAQQVTYSAVKLDRIDNLNKPINDFAQALMNNFDDYVRTLQNHIGFKFRTYTGAHDMIDVVSFFKNKSKSPEIRAAARNLIKAYGYPVAQRERHATHTGSFKIYAPENSEIYWGTDGFNPPKEDFVCPPETKITESGAYSKVMQKDENGDSCIIFEQIPESINHICYTIKKPGSHKSSMVRTLTRSSHFYTKDFPATSPILAEGHTAGMEYSYGLAFNFTNPYSYKKDYEKLQFTKDTLWDEFLQHKSSFTKRSDILLIPDCANDFRNDLHLANYLEMLRGEEYDIYDFRYFDKITPELLKEYKTVIIFCGYNKDIGTVTEAYRKPDGSIYEEKYHFYEVSALEEFLKAGGNLLISGHNIEKDPEAVEFIKNMLSTSITGEKPDGTKVKGIDESISVMSINEVVKNINNEHHLPMPAILAPEGNAVSIFEYEDETSAGIKIENDNYKAVYLGFELESLMKKSQKSIFKSILEYLNN